MGTYSTLNTNVKSGIITLRRLSNALDDVYGVRYGKRYSGEYYIIYE